MMNLLNIYNLFKIEIIKCIIVDELFHNLYTLDITG